MKDTIINWSGGKDAAMALYKTQKDGLYRPLKLLSTVNEKSHAVPMHEIPEKILDAQAQSCGIDIVKIYLPAEPSNKQYQHQLRKFWQNAAGKGVRVSVFGDIFLDDIRDYREKQLVEMNVKAVFPLWKQDTKSLSHQFIEAGFKAIIVSVNANLLDKDFVGKQYDIHLLNQLPEDVDPCGENGEFHTLVYDGPVFQNQVGFNTGRVSYREIGSKKYKTAMWNLEIFEG